MGPPRARVKSAKVRPTPYVYFPPVGVGRTLADLTLARGGPHFSNFGPPAERRPFCGAKTFFVRRRLWLDFSRFDPRPEPTLATLLAPQSEDLFCGGARRCGVGTAPRFSTPGAKRPTLAGLVPSVASSTLVDLTPKYLTLVASSPW